MKKVLLVEDDGFKSDDIRTLLLDIDPSCRIDLATSVSKAISEIQKNEYDLIVLDMALPSHPLVAGGGAPLSLLTGGIEILFELQSLDRKDHCIVITQYPDIEICGALYPVGEAAAAMERVYGVSLCGCLEYSQTDSSWRSVIGNAYRKLCEY